MRKEDIADAIFPTNSRLFPFMDANGSDVE
jgi:hypothetical protein